MILIMQILRELRKNWYLFLILPVIVVLLVIFLTRNRPMEYESEASLYLHLPTQKGLSLTNEEYKQFEITTYFQNIMELSRSRKNLERIRLHILRDALEGKSDWIKHDSNFPWSDSLKVLNRLNFLIDAHESPNLYFELDAGITIYLEEHGLSTKTLTDLFQVNRQGNSNYIRINTKNSNPFHAAYFNELVINNILDIHRELNKGRLQADKNLFEKLVSDAKRQLDEKIFILENYKISNKIINLPEHTKAIVNQMVNIEIQLANLNETIKSKEKALNTIRETIGDTTLIPSNVNTNSRYIELKQQLTSVKQKENSEEQVAEINNLLKQLVGNTPIDVRGTKQELIQQYIAYKIDIEMTIQLIPLARAELKRIQSFAAKFAPYESNISTMEREIQTAQESYLILINKLNMAKTVEAGTGEHELLVVDAPTIPIRPTSTKRKLLVIAAAFIAFILIAVVIIVLELMDKGIWDTQDVYHYLKASVVAGLPSIHEIISTTDTTLSSSLTLIREQQLNAVSHFIQRNESTSKTIAITSAFENEGRHEIAHHIKQDLMELGYEVILRDIELENLRIATNEPKSADFSGFELIILPPTSTYTDWLKWVKKADFFLYAIRAGRVAEFIDHQYVQEIGPDRMKVVLNAIPADKLDDLGMSVEKERSRFRTWLKRVIHFEFKQEQVVGYF